MTEQELQELFQLLEAQGLRPELYDTPVPYYDNRVPCGTPHDLGDVVPDGYMMNILIGKKVAGSSIKRILII